MYQAGNVTNGCTHGYYVSPDLVAESKGMTVKEYRSAKEKGMNKIACILILKKYSEFLDEQDFPTVVLYPSAWKMCTRVLEREWYQSTGEWDHGKLIAAANKGMWKKFLEKMPEPKDESDLWSAHQYTVKKILDLSVDEYQTLLCLQ